MLTNALIYLLLYSIIIASSLLLLYPQNIFTKCISTLRMFLIVFSIFQLNVSYPATGCQKLFEISDEHKLRIFYEKRMGAEVEADALGNEWKGYVVRISGGNDKQGFPMKQGVLTNGETSIFYLKFLLNLVYNSFVYFSLYIV